MLKEMKKAFGIKKKLLYHSFEDVLHATKTPVKRSATTIPRDFRFC